MSSVRMCDNCGVVFSENEEGWTTFTGSKMNKDKYGDKYSETVHKDACAKCSGATFSDSPKVIEAEKGQ